MKNHIYILLTRHVYLIIQCTKQQILIIILLYCIRWILSLEDVKHHFLRRNRIIRDVRWAAC